MHYKIKAQNITEEQLDKALQLAVKNCTIVQSVKDSIKVTETIELINIKRENTTLTFLCLERGESVMDCLGCKLANEEEKYIKYMKMTM